jgi:hypothetical protein
MVWLVRSMIDTQAFFMIFRNICFSLCDYDRAFKEMTPVY